jgi:Flp pilus assembly protein TadG
MNSSQGHHSKLRTTRSGWHRVRSSRLEHGQAALEIALVLPILLVLLLGIIIVAFMFYAEIQVTNAAREGARAGSVYRLTRTESGLSLAQAVRGAIYDPGSGTSALGALPRTGSSFDVTSSDVQISLVKPDNTAGDPTDPRPGDRLTVQITYRYTLPVISVMLPMFPQPTVFVRRVTMEIQ